MTSNTKKPYKFNPQSKRTTCVVLNTDNIFKNPPPIPKGCKIFLYYLTEDKFIEKGQVDKYTEEQKALIFWIPAINLKNAQRKVDKYFKPKT
jgi:hypothetical protein